VAVVIRLDAASDAASDAAADDQSSSSRIAVMELAFPILGRGMTKVCQKVVFR
jgi:hypothetical protein